jgi:CRP-like cAMP-binding protein
MVDDASVRIMDILSVEQRAELEATGTLVSYPPEHTIFWEGQPSRSVLIIKNGHVKVTIWATDGTEVILAVRGPGEFMGEEGVLMAEPRSATVTTITDVTGLDVSADDLLRFVDHHGLWPVMYRAAVRRRRQSDQRALLARLDVRSRLARWLLELAVDVGEQVGDDWEISASISQNDLAGQVGASREAVAIALRRLRADGVLTTRRQKIIVHDLGKLRSISRA